MQGFLNDVDKPGTSEGSASKIAYFLIGLSTFYTLPAEIASPFHCQHSLNLTSVILCLFLLFMHLCFYALFGYR